MYTRRDPRLDRYLNRLVTITFCDGGKKTGVLEYGRPLAPSLPDSTYYSIYEFGKGQTRFRKTHVKKIEAK